MANYFVGPGGNNANSGLTWALRRLTLTSIETLLVAGDTVYVGAGTYRETLTLGVSGTNGNPITYSGDYLGTNTDGIGGVVRITGSDNDQTATRTTCITAASAVRSYRTFQGIAFDLASSQLINVGVSACTNWIIQQCVFNGAAGANSIIFNGTGSAHTVQNCAFFTANNTTAVLFNSASLVDNTASLVQNCIFLGGWGVVTQKVGGITAKNCLGLFSVQATPGMMGVGVALTVGQTMTINNCVLAYNRVAVGGLSLGDVVENFNTFYGNGTDRSTVNTGASSVTYPPLFDTRPWFQLLLAGAGPNSMLQMLSPFDLASYSQLVNLAGTSPTATDLRGTGTIGAQREWGALEYDSTLKLFGGIHKGRRRTGD